MDCAPAYRVTGSTGIGAPACCTRITQKSAIRPYSGSYGIGQCCLRSQRPDVGADQLHDNGCGTANRPSAMEPIATPDNEKRNGWRAVKRSPRANRAPPPAALPG